MPIGFNLPDATFSANPGFAQNPFVATGNLLTAWDFRRRNNLWKTGLVAGQTATSYIQNGTSTVADSTSASYTETPDGLGVALTAQGYVTAGYTMSAFQTQTNNGATGRTFLAFGRVHEYGSATQTSVLLGVGWAASTHAIALGARHLNTGTVIGAAVEGSTVNFSRGVYSGKSHLIILRQRPHADNFLKCEWVENIPFMDQNRNYVQTGAALSVANSEFRLSNGSPWSGPIYFGNFSPTLTSAAVPTTHYCHAIWNKHLSDAEVAEQVRRISLMWKPVCP